MPMLRNRSVLLAGWLMIVMAGCGQQPSPATGPAEAADQPAASGKGTAGSPDAEAHHGAEETDDAHIFAGGAHQDHDSKHGGTFFMALDNRHHLEGTLVRPGVFQLYIYDAYTEPISAEELRQVDAKVIWGEKDGAPQIQLEPRADGSLLEARAPEPVRFPLTITLLCRFPGAAPNSRPELFTFPFSHFSHIDATPHTH